MRFVRLFRPCCALVGAALGVLAPRPARAQQDMFNVPTGTITPPGKIYFQNQFEFGETGESELTLDVGLGKGFEVGMNIRELVLYPGHSPLLPDDPARSAFTGNMQWGTELSSGVRLAIGTQQGVSAHDAERELQHVGMGWAGLRIEPEEGRFGEYMVGAYLASQSWGGAGAPGGGMLGIDAPIIPERLELVADCMLGTNRQSVEVVGLDIMPVEDAAWRISIGAQIPGPFAPRTDYAVVFALTHEAKEEQ